MYDLIFVYFLMISVVQVPQLTAEWCRPGFTFTGTPSMCLAIDLQLRTYTDSFNYCGGLGGILAEPRDRETNDVIQSVANTLGVNDLAYIGIIKLTEWVWVSIAANTNNRVAWFNWEHGWGSTARANTVVMNSDGEWRDINANDRHAVICQSDVLDPPTLTLTRPQSTVGGDLELLCNTTATGVTEFEFKPLGGKITSNTSTIDTAQLTTLQENFTCVVYIGTTASGDSNTLTINLIPGTPTLSVSPAHPTDGEDVQLQCQTVSLGDVRFEFQNDVTTLGRSQSGTFLIPAATIGRDDVTYTCTAIFNNLVSGRSDGVDVKLKPKTPTLSAIPGDSIVSVYTKVTLSCHTDSSVGGDDVTYTFYRDDDTIIKTGGENSLTVATSVADSGLYGCQVVIRSVHSEASQQHRIDAAPVLSVDPPGKSCSCIDHGRNVTFSCDPGRGLAQVTDKVYSFLQDGTIVYRGAKNSTTVVTRDDNVGVYACMVDVNGRRSTPSYMYKLVDCVSSPSPCGSSRAHKCQTTDYSYNCKCGDGFVNSQKSPPECVDLDECQSSDTNNCQQDDIEHKCVNSPGSYTCVCRDGYENVNPNFCDKIVAPPSKPRDSGDLPDMPAVKAAATTINFVIVLFIIYVGVADIYGFFYVLYIMCTTVPVPDSDSDDEDDKEAWRDVPEINKTFIVGYHPKVDWGPQLQSKYTFVSDIGDDDSTTSSVTDDSILTHVPTFTSFRTEKSRKSTVSHNPTIRTQLSSCYTISRTHTISRTTINHTNAK